MGAGGRCERARWCLLLLPLSCPKKRCAAVRGRGWQPEHNKTRLRSHPNRPIQGVRALCSRLSNLPAALALPPLTPGLAAGTLKP